MSDRTRSACVAHGYDVVAIACSAGGLQALREILSRLDESFPAPILVAMHRGDASSDYFATMLQRSTVLEVRQACEGERPQAGTVYVAPGGCHLEVTPAGRLSVRRRGRIDFVCPSADVLFRSVAARYGSRAMALVLSGDGSDGAEGLSDVCCAGGFVLAQDPHGCEHPGMPTKAIETRKVDLVLPLDQLGFALNQIA